MKVKRKPLSTFESKSAKDSINFAFELSKNFKKGDLILLVGDIGSGKTTFLNGVLKYLGSNKTVTSSSFVLVSIYQAKKANLIHCDFYRINGRYFFDEIVEYLNDGIVAVEWPYDIKKYLCFKPFLIKISIEGINARKIEVFKYE
ncbi:MAG: tRNA (adenosine(37)-N6)-threonylcarbamoyltransferase complex ATPase subunit type 1 TsaE [Elusimicrobiales bacterium]